MRSLTWRKRLRQGFPSGQRGWTQNPLLSASQVRILYPAFFVKIKLEVTID